VLRTLHAVAVPGIHHFAGRVGWAAGLEGLVDHWGPRSRAAGLDGGIIEGARAAATRLVRTRPGGPPLVTMHGDCVPIHVRLNGRHDVVGLLDLGDACRGDPVWDLAVLTLRSPERLPAVLDGYEADAELRAWADRAVPTYRALRFVAEVGWLAEHGFDPTESIQAARRRAAVL
jgi:Ser/Thr protein kinase RdoA (MazF antagonist)